MKFLIFISFFFFSFSALSKDSHSHHGKKEEKHLHPVTMEKSPEKVLIKVKGMVCAFCAQGIEKNFNSRKEVESTKVDLDKMEVLVKYKKGQSLTDKQLKKIVTGAGFSFVGAKNE